MSVVPIHLLPLRERREDIPVLARNFREKYSLLRKKHIQSISSQAMAVLTGYQWPGNIRELENTIERAVVLSRGNTIEASDILCHGITVEETPSSDHNLTLDEISKRHIKAVLKSCGGNISKAARILGIDRKTLRRKLGKAEPDGEPGPS